MAALELIVTQWDVNFFIAAVSKEKEPELIVTQWDVNLKYIYVKEIGSKELIVTQWDVNTDKSNAYADDPGINSYIVGCK